MAGQPAAVADTPNAPQILRAAADILERNGWIQCAYFTPLPDRELKDCPVCAVGAINIALHTSPHVTYEPGMRTWDYVTLVDEFLDEVNLPDWNDEPGRTIDEVTAALRDCADELDAREAKAGDA